MSQRFCTNCGTSLATEAVFCTECGTELAVVDSPEAEEHTEASEDTATGSEENDPAPDEIRRDLKPEPQFVEMQSTDESKFCTSCGANLKAEQSFCTSCGTRPAAPAVETALSSPLAPSAATPLPTGRQVLRPPSGPLADTQSDDKKLVPAWTWLAVALLVVALGALGAWTFFGHDEIATSAEPSATTVGAEGLEDARPATDNPTTQPDLVATTTPVDCAAVGEDYASKIRAWATALQPTQIAAAPSIASDTGCDEGLVAEIAIQALESDLTTVRGWTRAGLLAFQSNPQRPTEPLITALDTYPQRPLFSLREYPTPSWVVVLESLEANLTSEGEAEARMGPYNSSFPEVTVVLSDDYISLRAGYWAILGMGFPSFDSALASCQAAGLEANRCYPRLLQDVRDQGDVMGGCGYFGLYDVNSASTVQLHPRFSDAEIRGQLRAGTQIHAAGPVSQANAGKWLPVVGNFADGNRMGWVLATGVTLAPECQDQPRIPEVDNCDAIAEEAIRELTAATPASAHLESIVARAGFAGCDADTVNASVSAGLAAVDYDDAALALRALVWSEVPFLEESP